MAHAFLTPSAHLDVLDWYTGGSNDWVLTPTVMMPDGRSVRQEDLFRSGWMQSSRIAKALEEGVPLSLDRSSTEEMRRVIDRVCLETADSTGWRAPFPLPSQRPNRITLPPRGNAVPRFIDL